MDVREALLGSKVAVWKGGRSGTVDGNQKSGIHQLRLVVYPIIYRVLAPAKRWLFGISGPSTVGTIYC